MNGPRMSSLGLLALVAALSETREGSAADRKAVETPNRVRVLTNSEGGTVVVTTNTANGKPILELNYLAPNAKEENIVLGLADFDSAQARDGMFEKLTPEECASIFTAALFSGAGKLVAVAVPLG